MKKNSNFIARSLMSVVSFLKDSVFAEEYTLKKGFLQAIDPRIKVISFALFFITAIFLKRAEFLIFLYSLCLGLVVLSKINLGYFLKRTWVFIPLFSLVIATPSIFSIFSPGEPIAILKASYYRLAITKEGLCGVVVFILRVLVSVSYASVLSLTTPHTTLLRVLRIFKVSQVFIMTMGMCYRYIYLFVEIIENTYLSIRSRAGGITHYKKGQKIVAWNIAYLWQRSYGLSQQVYDAMISRGYAKEARVLDDFKVTLRDFAWLLFTAALCSFVLLNGRSIGK